MAALYTKTPTRKELTLIVRGMRQATIKKY